MKTKGPELTVGWDSEFYYNELIQKQCPISHQLYIFETQEEILIDCIESGPISSASLIGRIQALHPDITQIALVTHLSRAEFSSIEDGRDVILGSDAIYSSNTISGRFTISGVTVDLYDTYQLTSMSLEKIGKLLGIEKVDIGEFRSNKIIDLYNSNKERFWRYASQDAKITVFAFNRIREIVREIGLDVLPKTVGGIGSAILARKLKANVEAARSLGYFVQWNKKFKDGKIKRFQKLQAKEGMESKFSEILYGGRNEVFLRGYIPDCTVFDYDLLSAYGTAQTTIGQFDFSNPILFNSARKCFEYLLENPFSYGRVYAEKWRHKRDCRYPVLIYKVNNAGIFVREANQKSISSFEFLAAYDSFAEIKGFSAVIYPRIDSTSLISEFQSDIREKRDSVGDTDQFKGQFLKIVANSTYGKFAQGYSGKNTLNLKKSRDGDLASNTIPKSPISNSFIASYITSLVRAIAFETLNHLGENLDIRPLYWTTDGFAVTQPVPDEIINGNFGIVSKAVADHRETTTGERKIFDLKHDGKG